MQFSIQISFRSNTRKVYIYIPNVVIASLKTVNVKNIDIDAKG